MFMNSRWQARIGLLLFSLSGVLAAQDYRDDPPGVVARLNHSQGVVSYSPAGENDWIDLERNRPIVYGDRLWTDRAARLELQIGNAAVRLGSETSFEILQLDHRIAQLEMTQGVMNIRIRRLARGQTFEIATPRLVFTITRAGRYRVDFDPRDDRTGIIVWEGAGEVWGDGANFPLADGESVRFYDADLRDYEMFGLPRDDDFDRYCRDRDYRLDRSASLRYVNDDVAGYLDLDDYGSWRRHDSYGDVWFPRDIGSNWAPYRNGHWVWQEPWGWTWIDDAPWGFAPSHYGRWVQVTGHWGWIPGPRNRRPVYAPAVVAFIGGSNWSLSLSFGRSSPIGWFPLGPREAYVPTYRASRDYFTRINVNNTTINNTTITNIYNNYASGSQSIAQQTYVNRTVADAITAVPAEVFVNSRPVQRAIIRLDHRAQTSAQIARTAPVAPIQRSVLGASRAARAQPSRDALNRAVIARTAPPPAAKPFKEREQLLQRTPGIAPERSATPIGRGQANTARNIRLLNEQRAATNIRDAGSIRRGAKPNEPQADVREQSRQTRQADDARAAARGAEAERVRQAELKQRNDQAQQARDARQAQRTQQAQQAQDVRAAARDAEAERVRQADSDRRNEQAQQAQDARQARQAQQAQQAQDARQAQQAQQAQDARQAQQAQDARSAARAAEADRVRQADLNRRSEQAQQAQDARQAQQAQQEQQAQQAQQARDARAAARDAEAERVRQDNERRNARAQPPKTKAEVEAEAEAAAKAEAEAEADAEAEEAADDQRGKSERNKDRKQDPRNPRNTP